MNEKIISDVDAEKIGKVLEKLERLSDLLEVQAPDIANHMLAINRDLRQYPELVHLLSDEQIAPIYRGAIQMSQETFAATAKKKATKAAKAETKAIMANITDLL